MQRLKFISIAFFALLIAGANPVKATINSSNRPTSPQETESRYVSKIDVKKGESWWGLFVSDAPMEPFLKPFKINTADSPISGVGRYAPMMLSSAGRYIWSDKPMEIEFDGSTITIGSDYEQVKAVKAGRTLRDAYIVCLHKHMPPSGKVPHTCLFSMPLYETEIELGRIQGEQEILSYASRIVESELPTGIIVIADGWRSSVDGYRFDVELYPDPQRMIAELHQMGFKVMLTVTPYLAAAGKKYVSELERGHLIRDKSGAPLVFKTSDNSHIACYDISDPAQLEIVHQGIEQMKDSGIKVDGYRFDCTNALAQIEDQQQRETFLANWMQLGESNDMCDFLPGTQTPLASHITNIDMGSDYSWERMSGTINNMVSAGLVGFPYSHISTMSRNRAEMPADDKLLTAWIQLFSVMPVMKIEFAPWRISDQNLYQSVVKTIKMRAEIGPYVEELVEESARTGEPLLRHMEYQFPKMGFADCTDQFMLGSKYLFAPNINNQPKRMVRLPKGVWSDRSGSRFRGPMVTEVNNSAGEIAWFRLEGK